MQRQQARSRPPGAKTRLRRYSGIFASAVALSLVLPAQGLCQRLIDWPVRTWAGVEALTPGAGAVFWNPAATAFVATRGELTIVDIDGPESSGVGGFAAALTARLPSGTVLGLGVNHLGVGEIPHTTTSPNPEPNRPTISPSDDLVVLSVAHPLGTSLVAGFSLQADRTDDGIAVRTGRGTSAGLAYRGDGPARPNFGVSATRLDGRTQWIAGGGAGVPLGREGEWTLDAAYGVSGGSARPEAAHRFVFTGAWSGRARVTAGTVAEGGDGDRVWAPVVSADVRLGNYLLGVVREELGNQFGNAYYFRFDIAF